MRKKISKILRKSIEAPGETFDKKKYRNLKTCWNSLDWKNKTQEHLKLIEKFGTKEKNQ